MPVSLDQFVQRLTDSEVLSGTDLRTLLDGHPPAERPADGEQLARLLVKLKKLTAYQAQQLYSSKGTNLVLGNYLILDKLGQGGMGMVLKAQHKRMKRIVALKVLSPSVTKTKELAQRFQREVEAAARLTHPNIVAAYDADEARGTTFLVMEYVEGSDLSTVVKKKGPLAVNDAVHCILHAARGLEFAHKQGVIHRDIKPANLLLDLHGTVKILDMGLARLEGEVGGGQAELTHTGAVMGTIDYMAPEQALSTKSADARSDIYSLGITLWYLLVGRAAYDGESLMARMLAHRETPIPSLAQAVAARRPGIAIPGFMPSLDNIFRKMVAKKASDRYQTMTEVIAALEGCLKGEAVAPSLVGEVSEDSRFQEFLAGLAYTDPGVRSTGGGTRAATATVPATTSDHTVSAAGSDIVTDPQTVFSSKSKHSHSQLTPPFVLPPWARDRRAQIGAAVAGGLVLLLTVILLFRSSQGTIRVAIDDPEISVQVKGTDLVVTGADPHPIRVAPGEHTFVVTRGDFSFETKSLTLKKRDQVALSVEVVADRVEVEADGKSLGSKLLAKSVGGKPGGISDVPTIQWPAGGTEDYALKFDGKDDVVVIPSLDYDGPQITLEARVKLGKASDRYRALVAGGTSKQFVMLWGYRNAGVFRVVQTLSDRRVQADWSTQMADRTVDIAGVCDGPTLRFFVDGKLIGTESKIDVSPLAREPGFTLGAFWSELTKSVGDPFDGTLDEVRISKTARYTASYTPAARLSADEDTLALYHCDEGQGDVLRDASGHEHHGKLRGGPQWVRSEVAVAQVSSTEPGLSFAGPNDSVTANTLDFRGTAPVTMEAWVTPRQSGEFFSLARLGSATGQQLHLLQLPEGVWAFGSYGRDGGLLAGVSGPKFQVGRRDHVAGVWNGKQFEVYVNGTLVGGYDGDEKSFRPVGPLQLGGQTAGVAPPATPREMVVLHEVRVSKAVRYNGEFTPLSPLLDDRYTLAHYRFDEGQGDTLKDSSGNNHHGKIVGAKWVAPAPTVVPSPAKALPATLTAADGWVDLTAAVNPQTDAIVGTWTRTAGDLVNHSDRSRLMLPLYGGGSYEVQVEFTVQKNRPNLFALVLPAGNKRTVLLFEALTSSNMTTSGWQFPKNVQNEYVPVANARITPGRRQTMLGRVTVASNRVELESTLDGKPLVKWAGTPAELNDATQDSNYSPGRVDQPHFFVRQGGVAIHRVQWRQLTGESQRLAAVNTTAVAPVLEPGWTSLFNGRDLKGWDGDRQYWGVEQNAIVGQFVTPATLPKAQFLNWAQGLPTDFEFQCEYQIEAGDTGVEYGDATRPELDWQLELNSKGGAGGVYHRDRHLTDPGLLVNIDRTGRVTKTPLPPIAAGAEERPGGWNTLRIRAEGSRCVHTVNGSTVLDLTTDVGPVPSRRRLALEMQVWGPAKVRFRNLAWRPLSPTASGSADGWISLFNGRDLTGWTPRGFFGWMVRDGALVGSTVTAQPGWLMTNEDYADFELDLEYKLAAGSNSGVFLRADPDGAVLGNQFTEVQILDDDAPQFKTAAAVQKNGGVFGKAAPEPRTIAPAGQWNRMQIRLEGPRVRVTVNGTQVVDYHKLPHLKPGRIGLQLYPTQVEFRNLRVKRLPEVSQTSAATGVPLDLLAAANPSRGGRPPAGWLWLADELVSRNDLAVNNFKLREWTPARYRVECEFTRVDGTDALFFMLPVAGRQCLCGISTFPDAQNSWNGFGNIDGKTIRENPTGEQRSLPTLGKRQRLTVNVEATNADVKLSGSLDGRPLKSWSGPATSLSVPNSYAWPETTQFGLGTVNAAYRIHSLKLTAL